MIELKVNGASHRFDGDPDMPLLWYLRDLLALTGTKYGSGMATHGLSRPGTGRPRDRHRASLGNGHGHSDRASHGAGR